ncbi:hypothetical protein FACS189418_2780 [Clostridia bacterium]|nr:hypothetical protein FACS189418_2780 [Clostridia bacterium]
MRYIDHKQMGRSKQGWLDSHFHFSFAEYYHPDNVQFGVLRVINDDEIQPGTGFDTHPHQDMEIISYIIKGELTHKDSMGYQRTLTRGQAQYMSAGTGVWHSEYNLSKNHVLRLLQIWIFPDQKGYKPNYGDQTFAWEDRIDQWMRIAGSKENGEAPIQIHADINLYVTEISSGKELNFVVQKGRQAYFVLIEGKAKINGQVLEARDGMETVEEELNIQAMEQAHILLIEMKKEDHDLEK